MAVRLEHRPSFTQAFGILPLLRSIDQFYPDIEHWYVNRVIPGLMLGDDRLTLALDGTTTVGFCLGKQTPTETKIRCVRTLPHLKGSGVGIRLLDDMVERLESTTPLVTCPEELFHDYSRIFVKRYGFSLSNVEKGRYRRGKLEYSFN